MQEGLPVSFWKFVAGANAGVLPGAAAGCDGSMPCALWNFYRRIREDQRAMFPDERGWEHPQLEKVFHRG